MNEPDWQNYLPAAVNAAKSAGQILVDYQGKIQAKEKAPKDLVTEADIAAQAVIHEQLTNAFPEFEFVGEEDEQQNLAALQSPTPCWVVDPLDGTTNYVHQLQTYAVSIALCQHGKPGLAVIWDPISKECFTALQGGGAFCNSEPIHTSATEQLSSTLAAASFSARVPRGSTEIARFTEMLYECRAVRRMGSAALNLCYVAAGRLDCYFATSVKCWDVAAGLLLVTEAGGVVSDLQGGEVDLAEPRFVASANGKIHPQVLEVMGRVD